MENLKNTINKTETLLNNVKLAKQRINETVIRGGGYDFKSLDKAPERIKSLLKQYSKVAFGTFNIERDMRSLPTFKLDCDFKVKEFILQIRIKSPYTSGFYLDYQTLSCGEHFNGKHSVLLYDKNYGGQKIEMMLNNNTVTFDKPHAPYSEAVITYLNWMAIG